MIFEYKVRYRYKTGYKEFSFYATTEIEEFLNRNNIEYVRNMTDTVENRLFKEIERLHSIIKEVREYIENNSLYEQDYDYDYEENLVEYPPNDELARKHILEILDKENK